MHAGLWGLARCLRLESPGSVAGCVDLGPLEKPKPKDIVSRLGKPYVPTCCDWTFQPMASAVLYSHRAVSSA